METLNMVVWFVMGSGEKMAVKIEDADFRGKFIGC
jgi:hypothetical protein